MKKMYRYLDFFKDVFGPLCSRVTAPILRHHAASGCWRACLLGEPPVDARFVMYPAGSFAGTFGLMNKGNGMPVIPSVQ